jgi:hypothetical protein
MNADTVDASGRGLWRRFCLGAAVLLAGCGGSGSGQSGSAFTFLTVSAVTDGTNQVGQVTSSLGPLGTRNVSTSVCMVLQNNLKNPTVTAPTSLDNVQVTSYTVRLSRLDGGPSPAPFTVGTSLTVPAGTVSNGSVGGNTATAVVILVPAQLKNQAPLSTAPTPLNATADVVFQGHDGRGSSVQTEASVAVLFVASGIDTTCGAAAPSSSVPSVSSSSSASSVSSASSASS